PMREKMSQRLDIRVAQSVEHLAHRRVGPRALAIAIGGHRAHEVVLALRREPRHLRAPAESRKMALAAMHGADELLRARFYGGVRGSGGHDAHRACLEVLLELGDVLV